MTKRNNVDKKIINFFNKMNKKGQPEGVGLGTLVVIGIAVVAVVIIILGITGVGNKFLSTIGLLPDDLNSMAVACEGYSAQPLLHSSYCEFREKTIRGKKGWYNCEHIHNILNETLKEGPNFENIGCAPNILSQKCTSLYNEIDSEDRVDKIIVNGMTCEEITSS